MNLEDRLRSHMQSGDDSFVVHGRDAGEITLAGRRRTRRNQVGSVAAGGLLAFGLVFGIASQITGSQEQDVASTPNTTASAEMAALPRDPQADDSVGLSEAPGFFEHEFVVGVGDEFAGLRATEDGIVAITSADGIRWLPLGTNGIPSGADMTRIVYDDGVFAAAFVVYDEVAGITRSYIGTSADLATWAVEVVDLGEGFSNPFLTEVVLSGGDVVAAVTAAPPIDEFSEGPVEPVGSSIFAVRGPVGGPYRATILPGNGFGVGGLIAADGAAMFTVSTDDGFDVWTSTGGEWTIARQATRDKYPSLGSEGPNIYVADIGGVEWTADGGATWRDVGLPGSVGGSIQGVSVTSGGETLAMLFSVSSANDEANTFVLAAGADGSLPEVSLEGFVPERASVGLVAVNDEEALIEVFPEPEVSNEDRAASSGVVEEPSAFGPRYVRVPLT